MLVLSLIGFLALLALWGLTWQRQPKFAFGVFIGVGLAWILAHLTAPYFTGREEMPVWLPPLPIATIALTLLAFGILIWFQEEDKPSNEESRQDKDAH
jgi:uncharacterized membrane protein YccC